MFVGGITTFLYIQRCLFYNNNCQYSGEKERTVVKDRLPDQPWFCGTLTSNMISQGTLVMDYHKFSGLKQCKFIILQCWRSEVQYRSPCTKVSVGHLITSDFLCAVFGVFTGHLPKLAIVCVHMYVSTHTTQVGLWQQK